MHFEQTLKVHSALGALNTNQLTVISTSVQAANADPTGVYGEHAVDAIRKHRELLDELETALTAPAPAPAALQAAE